jgi:hypothetical protein
MTKFNKAIPLTFLGVLLVVFASWGASNRPRRATELSAFMRYQQAPTLENRDLWLKEQQVSEHQVVLRKSLGFSLAFITVCLIVYVATRERGGRVGRPNRGGIPDKLPL